MCLCKNYKPVYFHAHVFHTKRSHPNNFRMYFIQLFEAFNNFHFIAFSKETFRGGRESSGIYVIDAHKKERRETSRIQLVLLKRPREMLRLL